MARTNQYPVGCRAHPVLYKSTLDLGAMSHLTRYCETRTQEPER
jgi:hypothetical protein